MQVTPARRNDRMIAGPESPIASPMITKMPVPMIAPSPSAVRSRVPTDRFRPCSDVASPAEPVGLRVNRPPGVGAAVAIQRRYPARRRAKLAVPPVGPLGPAARSLAAGAYGLELLLDGRHLPLDGGLVGPVGEEERELVLGALPVGQHARERA